MHCPSRFIAACATGRIGDNLVERAVTLTVARTQGRLLNWCSDGWRGYAAILTRASRRPIRSGQRGHPSLVVPPDVRLTQTIKHRDEHGKLLSVEIRAALGEVITQPGTIHVERANGALRDRLNALTRKTHRMPLPNVMFPSMPCSICTSLNTTGYVLIGRYASQGRGLYNDISSALLPWLWASPIIPGPSSRS
ncbi:hypothetical protein [Ktedonobacter racemifer]|uniref:Transposase n=1 Tax=Ktedonobacter racemifer DSM 44963 TaxID=485913 RepID=D6TH31_KTERA|nr:hypothetical protein [Ktedonobacter racemifer]EFH90773.1 hypothetical protein Krac_12408 [Ktedonobacter racemifer DSM 44963]